MNKQNAKTWVQIWLTPSMVLGGIVFFAWKAGYFEQRMFETPEQRIKTKTLVDAPYNEYQLLMKRDSVLRQGEKVEKIEKSLMIAFDSINVRWKDDIEDKTSRISSRNKRDSLDIIQTQQMDELVKDDAIQKGINLQILDELKDIRKAIDTTN